MIGMWTRSIHLRMLQWHLQYTVMSPHEDT